METGMTGGVPATAKKLAAALLATAAALGVGASAASAAAEIYNNIPSPMPGNLPSVGFEATQTSEFGGQIRTEAGTWKNAMIVVTLSSWACQEGTWFDDNCETTPGAKFEWPVTFNVYRVGPENSVGELIGTRSKVFKMPYRPSASPKCTGESAGAWLKMGKCYNGKAFKVALGLKIAQLPKTMIVTVAYDTSDFGAEPQRPQESGPLAGCNAKAEGCPYDSLNMAVREAGEGGPTSGSDPLPDSAYINSTTAGNYCSNPGAVGTFGISEGCWTDEQPAIEVKANG
jgi:hypothetical protein